MDEEARNDFENSLRRSAEDFRVRPSDKVWDGVYRELHGGRRTAPIWWAAAAVLLLGVGIWGVTRYESHRAPMVTARTAPARTKAPGVATGPVSGDSLQTAAQRRPSTQEQQNRGTVPQTSPVNLPGTPASSPVAAASPRLLPGSASARASGAPSGASLAPSYTLSGGPFAGDPIPFRPEASFLSEAIPGGAVWMEAPAPREAVHGPVFVDSMLTGDLPDHLQPPATPAPHRLLWGIYVTPGVGYRNFASGKPDKGTALNMDPSPPGSRPSMNFIPYQRSAPISYQQHPQGNWAAGIQIFYPLKGKWSLQSGLGLTQTGYQARVYEASPAYVSRDGIARPTDAGRPVNSGTMSYASSAVTPKTSDFHIRYLSVELPVMVHRSIGAPGSLSLDLGAGAGLTYLAASRSLIYSPVSGRYFSNKHYLRDVNANLHLEAAVVIPVTRNLRVTAGPSFQYQAGSTYKGYDLVKEHPYFLGLQVGLKWVP